MLAQCPTRYACTLASVSWNFMILGPAKPGRAGVGILNSEGVCNAWPFMEALILFCQSSSTELFCSSLFQQLHVWCLVGCSLLYSDAKHWTLSMQGVFNGMPAHGVVLPHCQSLPEISAHLQCVCKKHYWFLGLLVSTFLNSSSKVLSKTHPFIRINDLARS